MINLADKVRALRGQQTYAEFAKRTGVSVRTLHAAEHNQPVSIRTLKQVTRACRIPEREWLAILILWFRNEIGDDQFFKLDVAPHQGPKYLHRRPGAVNAGELVQWLFFTLSNVDQAAVLKAMARPGVRACLPVINKAYEQARSEWRSSKDPELIENVARRLQAGDILFSSINAPQGKILLAQTSKPKRSTMR